MHDHERAANGHPDTHRSRRAGRGHQTALDREWADPGQDVGAQQPGADPWLIDPHLQQETVDIHGRIG